MLYALGGKVWPEKWGTSDVAVPDTVGRGVGPTLLQIAAIPLCLQIADIEGSLKRVRLSEEG